MELYFFLDIVTFLVACRIDKYLKYSCWQAPCHGIDSSGIPSEG